MKIANYIARLLVGSLFIVSGLIKANDALGFSYKLQEYFSLDVLNIPFLEPIALQIAMVICIVEVVLGIATLMGAKMRLVSWSLLGMIVFFTFLTFYSAYFDKVTDCGCFGDALKLTPWESFTKDVVLLFFVLIIFIQRNKVESNTLKEDITILLISLLLIAAFSIGVIGWSFPVWFSVVIMLLMLVLKNTIKHHQIDWILGGAATLATGYFTYYCYSHLPIQDFRPYAVGKSIPEQMVLPEGAQPDVFETVLTYKNSTTGEIKDFNQQNYPWKDSTWVWQDTKTELIKEGDHPPIHDFNLIAQDGNDYTQDILAEQYIALVIEYDISAACEDAQPAVNEFVDKANSSGLYVYGLSASSYNEVEEFRHKHQNMFDFLTADATMLKTIIRASPGIVLLKEGTVIGKWHHNDIPDFEEVKKLMQ